MSSISGQTQRDMGRALAPVLRGAHEARHSAEWVRQLAELSPVPAIRVDLPSVEDQLGVMVLAYAILVDELLDEKVKGW